MLQRVGIDLKTSASLFPPLGPGEFAYFFGSLAWGLGSAESDLDAVVVANDDSIDALVARAVPKGADAWIVGSDVDHYRDRAPLVHYRHAKLGRLIDIAFHPWSRISRWRDLINGADASRAGWVEHYEHARFFVDMRCGVVVKGGQAYREALSEIDTDTCFGIVAKVHCMKADRHFEAAEDAAGRGDYRSSIMHAQLSITQCLKGFAADSQIAVSRAAWVFDALIESDRVGERDRKHVEELWDLMNQTPSDQDSMRNLMSKIRTVCSSFERKDWW